MADILIAVSKSAPIMCTLPSVAHSATSPQCWKNQCCQKLVLDRHLQPQSAVCHACRNELSRRTKDPNHKPRWEKDKQVKCAILNCEKQLFSHRGIPLDDIVGCLNKNGESIPTNLKTSVPTITTLYIPACPVSLPNMWFSIKKRKHKTMSKPTQY